MAKLPFVTWFLACLSTSLDLGAGFAPISSFRRKSTRIPDTRTRLHLSPQQLGSFKRLQCGDDVEFRCVVWRSLLDEGPIDYDEAWNLQKKLLVEHIERLAKPERHDSFWDATDGKTGLDTVIALEHEPVYTLGTASDERFLLQANEIPVKRINRGGEITYHGTGQLTVYPVLDLRSYSQDIHWYVRALEEAVILAFADCGITASRDKDTTGVWVNDFKVAAVGVNCKKWITQHGVAINVLEDSLLGFEGIIPCGLKDRKVGYVNQFIDDPVSLADFADIMNRALEQVFEISIINYDR